MSRPRTDKGTRLADVATELEQSTPITKVCRVCGKLQDVKGVSWEDISQHLNVQVPYDERHSHIQALCAPCAYKASRVGIEPTEDQKEKRKAASLKRAAEVKQALAMFRAQATRELDAIIDND